MITGASGGIGRQIAIQFAEAGCDRLVIQYHRQAEAALATASSARQRGADAVIDCCDFADLGQSSAFIARAFDRWPSIDAWVHCAGADVLTGELADQPFDRKLRRLIDVDLIGAIHAGRTVGERLRVQAKTDAGRKVPSMIFIGWDQATEGMEGEGGQIFSPIKAGVEAFAKSLAQDLAPAVRVNVIAPGWIKTAWGQSTSDYWNQRAANQSLMNRWGDPCDIAAAAVFLSTPTNDFITGQTLAINGGWNRRYKTGGSAPDA